MHTLKGPVRNWVKFIYNLRFTLNRINQKHYKGYPKTGQPFLNWLNKK